MASTEPEAGPLEMGRRCKYQQGLEEFRPGEKTPTKHSDDSGELSTRDLEALFCFCFCFVTTNQDLTLREGPGAPSSRCMT